jgi:tRNA-dihydrouridine synthase A
MVLMSNLLSIAPMIDWTYTHFRVFMRLLAPKAFLYTEMLVPAAILHHPKRLLSYHPMEHPLALQLGGSDPRALVASAMMAEAAGFDEINLNLGCPSDKVQSGGFGACLMKEPLQVVKCIQALKQAVSLPVSAKVRIGVDSDDSYEFFSNFVRQLLEAGCDKLIVHARKAYLQGLSPKQNRTIPPIHYDYAYQIKQQYPAIPVIVNGNISSLHEVQTHLQEVDGVMFGRLCCQNPYQIAEIHQALYPEVIKLSRAEVLDRYTDYLLEAHENGAPLSLLLKPLFNLTCGQVGAASWRKQLMQVAQREKAGELLRVLMDELVGE